MPKKRKGFRGFVGQAAPYIGAAASFIPGVGPVLGPALGAGLGAYGGGGRGAVQGGLGGLGGSILQSGGGDFLSSFGRLLGSQGGNRLLGKFYGGGQDTSDRYNLLGSDGGDLSSLLPLAFLNKNTTGRDVYNLQRDVYGSTIPSRQKALQLGTENLGRTDFSAQTPELLKTARAQTAQRLATPFKSAYSPEALANLRTSSLSEFDREFQRQQAAENEKLNLFGLDSSGPGFEQRRLTGESGARSRALLGNQFDVANLERVRQAQQDEEAARTAALGEASNLGTQEFNINQLLGYQEPLNLLKYGGEIPQFNVPEQDQSNALLAYLLSNMYGGTDIGRGYYGGGRRGYGGGSRGKGDLLRFAIKNLFGQGGENSLFG